MTCIENAYVVFYLSNDENYCRLGHLEVDSSYELKFIIRRKYDTEIILLSEFALALKEY
jgi:hypothetical protein